MPVMPPNSTVQILTSLEYLGPYPQPAIIGPGGVPNTPPPILFFGVVLQVGVGVINGVVGKLPVDLSSLLQPWNWTLGPGAIQVWKGVGSAQPTQIKVLPFSLPVGLSLDPSIKGQLSMDCTTAIAGNNFSWTDPRTAVTSRGDGKRTYPWPAHLAQVARYPYPIPHLLNLCFFLQVTDKTFDPTQNPAFYFATVKFSTTVNGAIVTYGPPDPASFPAPVDGRLSIGVSADDTVFVTTQTLSAPLTSAASVIDPSGSLTPETTDWQAHLVSGTADLLDLSSRLVNSVRQACDPPPQKTPPDPNLASSLKKAVAANFTAYTTAVITAQREILAYGIQPGPNGKSLLDRLLDGWVAGGGDRVFATGFSKTVATQRKSDSLDTVVANDRWLLLVKSSPAFLNDSLIPLTPAPPTGTTVYDSHTTYKKSTTVIYQARLFTALRDGFPIPLAVPGSAGSDADWNALSPPTALRSILVPNLPDRLIAIEHLQLQFSQSDLLSQLLLAQWTAAFSGGYPSPTADESRSFRAFFASASTALANLDVRGLLLQCNLGPSWTACLVDTSSRAKVRTNLSIELSRRVQNLFNILPNIPPSNVLSDPINNSLAPWLSKAVNTLLPDALNSTITNGPPPANTANPQPTRTSDGLSVLVDSLNDGSGNDATDTLRSISGLCVLMRQSGASNPWRCLNAGVPIASLATGGNLPAIMNQKSPVVIPVPLHNQDGLRRATLTYNNQPLMCSSPAHGFSTGLVPTQSPSGNSDRLISYQHPSVTQALDSSTALQQWKIPGLAFNRSFDLLFGRVSNSGALPFQFADPTGGPAVLGFTSVTNAKAADGKALPPTITSVPYRRTVPVSDLRFKSSIPGVTAVDSSDSGKFDDLRLPAIPSDVHPRSQELFPTATPSVGSTPGNPTLPLVVLTPYAVAAPATPKFTLSVRKPTTDFVTWDRTQAAADLSPVGTDSVIRKQRVKAWNLFNLFARQQKSKFNLALEDPAVGSLTINVFALWPQSLKLTPVGPTGADNTLSWTDANISDPAPSLSRLQTDTPAIDIVITSSLDAKSGPTAVKSGPLSWSITLPPGSIAQIQLTPNLKPGMEQLFAPGILQSPKPYTVLVETANAVMPQRKDLYDAFNVVPPLSPTARSVDFSLAAPPSSPAWLQISRVDLQTQVWRWDGRPFRQFPFSDVASIAYDKKNPAVPKQSFTESLLKWELETFATRSASDSTLRPMTRMNAADPIFQAHDDRGSDLGATYYRAGVTAYNRYGSLVPVTITSDTDSKVELAARSCSSLNEFASVPGIDGNWTRRFIPGRISADASVPTGFKPPKPAIKYIVPLTGSSTVSQPAASSALIVVQGPWFAIAGLAEDISATITNSTAPRKGSSDPRQVQEAGPDPILYYGGKASLPAAFDTYGSPFTPPENSDPHFHGPVGHTFDSSDTNPLWVTSSFVLDPPTSNGKAAQEGTFARIQFTRVVRHDGIVVQNVSPTDPKCSLPNPPPTTPVLIPACSDFESDPTDPVWIQFLPSRFFPYSESFDNLTINYNSGSISVNDQRSKAPITLTLNPVSAGDINLSHLVFGILITQLVPDLLGRPNQERFVDLPLLKPSSNGKTTASWSFINPPGIDETNLIGRMVVIQRQVNTSIGCDPKNQSKSQPPCDLTTKKELWDELFPSAKPNTQFSDADAISRIVAVSPPILASDSPQTGLSCEKDTTYAAGD
jgi:hypothetical protein